MIKFSITGTKREINQFYKLLENEVKNARCKLDAQFPDAYNVQDCTARMVAIFKTDLPYFNIQELRSREFFHTKICMEKGTDWTFIKESNSVFIKSSRIVDPVEFQGINRISAFSKNVKDNGTDSEVEEMPELGEFDDVEQWEEKCAAGYYRR